MAETSLLRFARYVVDCANEQLRLDNQPVPLTNKAFAVLRYLVEHPGQLVTKEALFAAVWPETVVGETTLTNCIGEVRRALGDDAKQPQFIETAHRRGYRFIAKVVSSQHSVVSSEELAGGRSPHSLAPNTQHPAPHFVGREAELAQMHNLFAKALNGERQLVFVTGEAGIGKTALVDAFRQRLETGGWRLDSSPQAPSLKSLAPPVSFAHGQCVEQYGVGEAYLPVLEALGRLGRQPGGERLLTILDQYAPTWLLQLPALLTAVDLEALQRRVQGATRERMLREITEAFDVLTTEQPLVVVLEDLHWSDPSTVEFLTTLARRHESARLFIVGTYRAAELAVTNHPLKIVKQELVARGQAAEMALNFLSPAAVREYVSQRVAVSESADSLAEVVYQRTDGQPLFMVQVTDYLVQRDRLTAQSADDLRAVEQTLPNGLRELIEAQLGRLTEDEQSVLAVGSVGGAEFTVASTAAGLEREEIAIEEICDRLAGRGQFIEEREVKTWPDGTVSGSYGFRHALYQQVLYTRIPEARRVRLHKVIGEREEQAYGERASEVAAELALHFEHGHDFRRAVQYLQAAAENALRRNAYAEAILLLTHALELLHAWPDTPARVQQELTLQFTLGAPLIALKGSMAPEVACAYGRTRELCRQLGDTPQLFPALMGLSGFHFARAELHTARELGELCFTMVQRDPSATRLMWVHYTLGQVLWCLGEFTRAKDHLEQGLALYQPQKHSPFVARVVQDPQVSSLCFLAVVLWFQGYVTQALATIQKAQQFAQELAHPYSLAWALDCAARLHQFCRETQTAREKTEALITLSQEQGFTHYLPGGTIRRGWILSEQGHGEEGIAQMRQGLATYRATVAELERPYYLALLTEAHGKNGQPEEGLAVLAEALAAVDHTGERYYEAELWRIKGELTLQSSVQRLGSSVKTSSKFKVHGSKLKTPSTQEAEECFLKAIDIAHQQQAKSLELRAVLSLARFWQQQGKRAEARDLLAEIYGWFTEGFDTKDLQEAQALLEKLV